MTKKMSRWGTGPIFTALSLSYGTVILVINHSFYPFFQIKFIPYWLLVILGIFLIAIGIPFFIVSVIIVSRAYEANELVTKGIYRCCRHPLYASWVVFIVPGIALLVNSWLWLSIPVFMYLILCQLVKKEEIYLESVFGSEYLRYKQKVPCIFPIGYLKK